MMSLMSESGHGFDSTANRECPLTGKLFYGADDWPWPSRDHRPASAATACKTQALNGHVRSNTPLLQAWSIRFRRRGTGSLFSARNIQDMFSKMPAKCENQKSGNCGLFKECSKLTFLLKNRRLRVFLRVFRVSISLLEYVGCFSSVMTVRAIAESRLR